MTVLHEPSTRNSIKIALVLSAFLLIALLAFVYAFIQRVQHKRLEMSAVSLAEHARLLELKVVQLNASLDSCAHGKVADELLK